MLTVFYAIKFLVEDITTDEIEQQSSSINSLQSLLESKNNTTKIIIPISSTKKGIRVKTSTDLNDLSEINNNDTTSEIKKKNTIKLNTNIFNKKLKSDNQLPIKTNGNLIKSSKQLDQNDIQNRESNEVSNESKPSNNNSSELNQTQTSIDGDQPSTNNTNSPDVLPAIPVKKKRGRKKKVVPGLALDPSVDPTSKNGTNNIQITNLDDVDASLLKKSTKFPLSKIPESLTPSNESNVLVSDSIDTPSIEFPNPDPELIEDESEIDAEGEKKIDSLGNLLGGREFVIPTFSFPNRMNSEKRYKYPLLRRVESTQEERDYLVNEGWVYQTFRWRSAYLVSARNFFRSFGAMSVKNGKHIQDDYWESLKLESGDFTPGETVNIRDFTIKRFTIPGQPSLSESS
ncbi:Chromatin structure-remodeling complex subunit RSC7, partial [Smittium culicis]